MIKLVLGFIAALAGDLFDIFLDFLPAIAVLVLIAGFSWATAQAVDAYHDDERNRTTSTITCPQQR